MKRQKTPVETPGENAGENAGENHDRPQSGNGVPAAAFLTTAPPRTHAAARQQGKHPPATSQWHTILNRVILVTNEDERTCFPWPPLPDLHGC